MRVMLVPNVGSVNGARYAGRDAPGARNTATESVIVPRNPAGIAERAERPAGAQLPSSTRDASRRDAVMGGFRLSRDQVALCDSPVSVMQGRGDVGGRVLRSVLLCSALAFSACSPKDAER